MKKSKKKPKKQQQKIMVSLMILLLLVILFIILNNSSLNKIISKENKKSEENLTEKIKEEKKLNIVDENSNQRPIAIMIDNNVGNNSHVGLADAYITYEISVEGGLTRIMALYKDIDTKMIGPVRSSRHYFLDYALESDAIYAHYGWSPYAETDIKNLKVNNINGLTDTNVYWREKNIKAPHNVFTSTQKIYNSLKDYNYKTTTTNWSLLNYNVTNIDLTNIQNQQDKIKKADNIVIKYSNYQTRSYKYDNNTKEYLRYMNNSPHIDKQTKMQYKYKNVIIEKVQISILDDYGRLDLNTTGTGEGYYMTNGYILPITWTKQTRTSQTIYKYLDNTEIKVNDGNTFIQIMPSNYDIEVTQEEQ